MESSNKDAVAAVTTMCNTAIVYPGCYIKTQDKFSYMPARSGGPVPGIVFLVNVKNSYTTGGVNYG